MNHPHILSLKLHLLVMLHTVSYCVSDAAAVSQWLREGPAAAVSALWHFVGSGESDSKNNSARMEFLPKSSSRVERRQEFF